MKNLRLACSAIAADGVVVCRTDGSTGYWLSPGLEADWQRRIHR